MVEKTWIATSVILGKLTIHQIIINGGQPAIQLERRYRFVDGQGAILGQIVGGRVVEIIPIAEIPANILDALQQIDTWTEQKALEQEKML